MKLINWLTTNDIKIFSYVNQSLKCRLLDFWMPIITHLGGATFTIVLPFTLIFFVPSMKLWAIQALIALTISHLIVRIIKKGYPRKRPYLTLPNTRTFPNPLVDYSFPSGHTTAVFSVAVAFSLNVTIASFILMPIAMIVGFSRMYLGLHYPTDCIIGAILGSVTALLVVYMHSLYLVTI